MKPINRLWLASFCLLSLIIPAARVVAQKPVLTRPQPSRELQAVVDEAAQKTIKRFADKGLKEDQLAITLIDVTDSEKPISGSYRGNIGIYPASVVKLFYLVATQRWLEDRKLDDTPELRRALKSMIEVSSNDATGYVVDVLSGTSSGIELSGKELKDWEWKRNAVNRYYVSQGYNDINAVQKTFCEDAFGREHAFRGPNGENRNRLTTDSTARLLGDIAAGRSVTAARSSQMMELLKRDFSGTSKDGDDQAHGFTGIALTSGMRLWSKAGWTSETRHDAAYIELPNGKHFVLVTFTVGHANERDIIPAVATSVLERMQQK
jgi:Beta-lactamase enzyme family